MLSGTSKSISVLWMNCKCCSMFPIYISRQIYYICMYSWDEKNHMHIYTMINWIIIHDSELTIEKFLWELLKFYVIDGITIFIRTHSCNHPSHIYPLSPAFEVKHELTATRTWLNLPNTIKELESSNQNFSDLPRELQEP